MRVKLRMGKSLVEVRVMKVSERSDNSEEKVTHGDD